MAQAKYAEQDGRLPLRRENSSFRLGIKREMVGTVCSSVRVRMLNTAPVTSNLVFPSLSISYLTKLYSTALHYCDHDPFFSRFIDADAIIPATSNSEKIKSSRMLTY